MIPTEKTLSSTNDWAKFWYYNIGVNVIPANTREKKPMFGCKQLQNNPLPEEGFRRWLDQDAFKNGLSIIPGKIRRGKYNGLYLIFIDFDKQRGIDEVLTREDGLTLTLQQAANKWIIEQHADSPHKAHAYFYSPIPFPNKSPDALLGIEIKGQGEHGIAFCTNSIHKDGKPYGIIGTRDPLVLTELAARELIQHLDQVCVKHGIQYLEKVGGLPEQLKGMIKNLQIDTRLKIPEGERHNTLISIANSILFRYSDSDSISESKLRGFFEQINNVLCDPKPLPNSEIQSMWHSAVKFVNRIKEQRNEEGKEEDSRQLQHEYVEGADDDNELKGIDVKLLEKLSPHIYGVISSDPPIKSYSALTLNLDWNGSRSSDDG